ncbi:MAG: cell wall-active antibiotics response protein [Firmicutes bacterium]|nr:cell wall-active antibiotics response protein [Bacillota bacterium]
MEGMRIWAIIAIALGCGLLLDALGMVELSFGRLIVIYWPALLVVWGAQKAARVMRNTRMGRRASIRSKIGPVLLMSLGVLLVAHNLGWLSRADFSFWRLGTAFLLIYLGVGWLDSRPKDKQVISSLVGELHYGESPFPLDDTWYDLKAGELRLDLTQAVVPNREVLLDFTLGTGEIEVLVPTDLPVSVQAHTGVGDLTIFDVQASGISRDIAWTSPDYAQATRRVKMFLEIKVGDVVIRHV